MLGDKHKMFLRNVSYIGRKIGSTFDDVIDDWRVSKLTSGIGILDNVVRRMTLQQRSPFPMLISGSGGLSVLVGSELVTLLRPRYNAYLFGLCHKDGFIYVTLLFHLGVARSGAGNTNGRMSAIVRIPDESIQAACRGDSDVVDYCIDVIEPGESFSYINVYNNELFAASYLGHVKKFQFSNSGQVVHGGNGNLIISKSIFGDDLFFYPYYHLNSVSINNGYVYVGAHMYTKKTNINSKLYRLGLDGSDPILFRDTKFISAHDMMISQGKFVGCDSGNGAFYVGEDCLCARGGFSRGVSISCNGYFIGYSTYNKTRVRRRRLTEDNGVAIMDTSGDIVDFIKLPLPTIYNIYAINVEEETQSQLDALNIDIVRQKQRLSHES